MSPAQAARLWAKIERRANWMCWPFLGDINSTQRREPMHRLLVNGRMKWRRARRLAYEELIGPIPAGFVLASECRNYRCANPFHGTPVVRAEIRRRFTARLTQCRHGHPRTPANLIVVVDRHGYEHKRCRVCQLRYQTAANQRARIRMRARRQDQQRAA